MACSTCNGLRHVQTESGFSRCPECFAHANVEREFRARGFPPSWENLNPERVKEAFGVTSLISTTIDSLLSGRESLVHAHGLPSSRRTAFTGTLAYGFIASGVGAQVLDSADLAMKHFSKTEEREWLTLKRKREACLFTLGREVENRIGFFYLREVLERATTHNLPLILLTDYPLSHHSPRYQDLMPLITAAKFDRIDLSLSSAL